jgi:hypothetical protein
MSVLTTAPLFAGTVTAGAAIARGEAPRIRIMFGAVAAAVMLSLFGRLSVPLARALAGLIILGSVLGPGYDLLAALIRLVK